MTSSVKYRADIDRTEKLNAQKRKFCEELSGIEAKVDAIKQKIAEIDDQILAVIKNDSSAECKVKGRQPATQQAEPVDAPVRRRRRKNSEIQEATEVSDDPRPPLDWKWIRALLLKSGPMTFNDIQEATLVDNKRIVRYSNENQKGQFKAITFALEPIFEEAKTNGLLVLHGNPPKWELTQKGVSD